jgi:hypothetical protein
MCENWKTSDHQHELAGAVPELLDLVGVLTGRVLELEGACALAADIIAAVGGDGRQRPWPNPQRDEDDLDEITSTLRAVAAKGIP